ncbi:MAG: DUF116 domain-containing protein [Endomicrobiales bacterium]|nr:DUF116 domain-containing protein [Endomicrobiales bacterium]
MKLCFRKPKSSDEACKINVQKKNNAMRKAFLDVPFNERVIFVPHCLRNVSKCRAKEMGSHYICLECGACKIADISKKSKELGYKALFILKGGKAVTKLAAELKPKGIIGVACYFEGEQGMKESQKHKIPVQFVALTKDGCVDTNVDLNEVFKTIRG